jgi:hypothetical protein
LLERIIQDPDAAAHDFYFDVVSLHIYFRTETVYRIVGETRALLDSYGMASKTIWINETNVSPNLDPLWLVERPQFQMDVDQQAHFVIQAAALGLAGGAERIAVYKLIDQNLPAGEESFGLLRPDGSRRPAFYAWQTVIRHMQGVLQADFAQTERADVVRLLHDDGRQTDILWARGADEAQVQIGATADKAYLINAAGSITIVRPQNGQYTLALDGATCRGDAEGCPVGGAVILLVQPAGASAVGDITTGNVVTLNFE